MKKLTYLLFIISLTFSGCTRSASHEEQLPPLHQPAYILSGYNVGGGFRHNALTIFDPATWKVHRQNSLPRSWARNFSRDKQGRLWIGFSGNLQMDDNRLQIYSPEGALLQSLSPCIAPAAGISFAANRAFVVCSESGFSGKLAVIDLETLEIEKTIELSVPDAPFLAIRSAANEEAVVISGLTRAPGGEGNKPGQNSLAIVVDPHSLEITARLPLGNNTDIWHIIPHRDSFYLLNVASWQQPREQANDLLVLTPGEHFRITRRAIGPSPMLGAIDGNYLYTYHNPTTDQANDDPRRSLSRLDLTSGKAETWALPDNWNAYDLNVFNGRILLIRWKEPTDAEDGVYDFDLSSGQLKLLMSVPDASSILLPESSERD